MIPLWNDQTPFFDPSFSQEPPYLVPYLLDDGKPHGCVIVCPGGGYSGKAKHEGEPIALILNQAGFHAYVLQYRVSPYRHPVPFTDAQRAIRYVRFHAAENRILPDHIGILGFSAGGHLAVSAGTHYDEDFLPFHDEIDRVSARPDCIIPCYGVISFGKYAHRNSASRLTGKPYEELTEEEIRYHSGECNINDNTPPCFLWHTAEDGSVPVENSLQMALALSEHKIPFALHVFPFGRHGIGLGKDIPLANEWPSLLCKWLKEFGY